MASPSADKGTTPTGTPAGGPPLQKGLIAGFEFTDPVLTERDNVPTPSTRLWAMVEWLGLTPDAANELNTLNAELIISSGPSGIPAATVDAIIQTTVKLANGRRPSDLSTTERQQAAITQAGICKTLMEGAVKAAGYRRAYARGNML